VRPATLSAWFEYWFDDRAGKVFCLVHAPNKEATEVVHREPQGLTSNQVSTLPMQARTGVALVPRARRDVGHAARRLRGASHFGASVAIRIVGLILASLAVEMLVPVLALHLEIALVPPRDGLGRQSFDLFVNVPEERHAYSMREGRPHPSR
jgi:hypothetical protein